MSPGTYRAIRKSLGLTQAELAAVLGVSPRTLQAHEAGETPIPEPVARLLQACERHPEVLDGLKTAGLPV
jgi:putative transcriptional regulator